MSALKMDTYNIGETGWNLQWFDHNGEPQAFLTHKCTNHSSGWIPLFEAGKKAACSYCKEEPPKNAITLLKVKIVERKLG